MKFILKYTFETGPVHEIPIEAEDLETAKKAANQWRVNELRIKGKKIFLQAIIPVKE